jgi:hypothetical protein
VWFLFIVVNCAAVGPPHHCTFRKCMRIALKV